MVISVDRFNSDIYKMKMGNVGDISDICDDKDVQKMLDFAKTEGYQQLCVKVPVADKSGTNAFLANGFTLVDTQIMYQVNTNQSNKEKYPEFDFRLFEETDRIQLKTIARDVYNLDQFHSNKNLPQDLSDLYYEEWINNLCNGLADKVMVAVYEGQVSGYITLKYTEDESAAVGLAAVRKDVQGRGIFSFMIEETLKMLSKENKKYMYYGTQLANEAVLRVMAKKSGIPTSCNHVLHAMLLK